MTPAQGALRSTDGMAGALSIGVLPAVRAAGNELTEPAGIDRSQTFARVIVGVVWVGTFILLAKVVGAAKEMAVAARWGTSAPVDAYLLVLRIFELPASVWASSLSVILVPLIFRLRETPAELHRFHAELSGATLVVASVVAGLAAAATFVLVQSDAFGIPAEVADLATAMVLPLALIVPASALFTIVFTQLIAAGRKSVSLLEAVPAGVLLITLLLFAGAAPGLLVWGTVVGYLAALVAVVIYQRLVGSIMMPRFRLTSPTWSGFGRSLLIVTAANFILSATTVVDQFMVVQLEPGAVATLSYANRLLLLIASIGATAVVRVTLPMFSRAHIMDSAQAVSIARKWALIFFLLGVAAIGVGWVAAPAVVRLVFERGAFTAEDTEAVASVLRFGLLQLPFYFSSVIFSQLWAAQGRYRIFLFANSINVVVKLVANVILIGPFGIDGIMMATALMYTSSLAISLYLVGRPSFAPTIPSK